MEDDPEDYEEPIPSATSPNDQGGNVESSSNNEGKSSTSSERTKELQSKGGADVNTRDLPPIVEGTGDSSSAAPTSSKPVMVPVARRTPPASTSTLRLLNDLGMPILSS